MKILKDNKLERTARMILDGDKTIIHIQEYSRGEKALAIFRDVVADGTPWADDYTLASNIEKKMIEAGLFKEEI